MARVGSPPTVGDVFVAGGLPAITYNPRSELGLEEQVKDYLAERHSILSISGPTKTGKTVLMKKVLADSQAIWISGGAIRSVADVWSTVADELNLDTSIETSAQATDTAGGEVQGELQLPGFAKIGATIGDSASASSGTRATRTRATDLAARKAVRERQIPLIIDDFHYLTPELQAEIVRSLKDLVFDGTPVVVVAVPHRAYDVLRVEKEMTGRVQQLSIGFWSNVELRGIAETGFNALNVIDEGGIIAARLAEESFASPHLMQDFCLNAVKDSGYRVRQERPSLLQQPSWASFFEKRASTASKTSFDALVRGPRQRTDRKPRKLKNGIVVDIYGAVLMAIGHTGPLTTLTYENLRAAMKEIAGEDAPRGQEITRILEEMSKIARDQIEGEPVVDYDSGLSTLHISDPYFAFFLRWKAAAELRERASVEQTAFLPPVDYSRTAQPAGASAAEPEHEQPEPPRRAGARDRSRNLRPKSNRRRRRR